MSAEKTINLNKNMQKISTFEKFGVLTASIILGAVLLFSFMSSAGHVERANAAGGPVISFSAFSDSTEVVGSTTASQLLLATSSSRQYAIIGNNSTSSTMFLGMTGGGAAVVNKGVMISAGASYEITGDNLYTGAIYVITRTNGGAVGSTTVAAKQ